VVGIVAHQEQARVFLQHSRRGPADQLPASREDRRRVKHYYFLLPRPRRAGKGSCASAPIRRLRTRIWLNAHGYLAARMAEQRIAVELDDKLRGELRRPQGACRRRPTRFKDQVGVDRASVAGHGSPGPLTAEERAAGYPTRLSDLPGRVQRQRDLPQDRRVLNRVYEQMLSEHLHMGRPDMIKANVRPPDHAQDARGSSKTRILREGTVACMKVFYKSSFLKQYNKSRGACCGRNCA